MTEQPKWERVTDDTERLPVRGGWLYRVRMSSTSNSSVGLCFVPDAKAGHMRELSRRRAAAARARTRAASSMPWAISARLGRRSPGLAPRGRGTCRKTTSGGPEPASSISAKYDALQR